MRVATIDIGTNTVLLLVAERNASGELLAIDERAEITRLGQGVDKTRALAQEAIARTDACLERYGAIVKAHGVTRVAVVGTSAMRDAGGGEAVRAQVKRSFGVDARVISGEEEARLTFGGALCGMPDASGKDVAVFDIGGGSTEVVLGRLAPDGSVASIAFAESYDVGSVRLTERHVRSDPPTSAELDAVRETARAAFARVSIASSDEPVGIAGTVTTLAAVAMGLAPYDGSRVHGHRMTKAELARVVGELAAMPVEARKAVPGLEPKRADVIVAGGIVALALLDQLGKDALRVSDRGVRWGLALDLVVTERSLG